jgi:hypothetical protein
LSYTRCLCVPKLAWHADTHSTSCLMEYTHGEKLRVMGKCNVAQGSCHRCESSEKKRTGSKKEFRTGMLSFLNSEGLTSSTFALASFFSTGSVLRELCSGWNREADILTSWLQVQVPWCHLFGVWQTNIGLTAILEFPAVSKI